MQLKDTKPKPEFKVVEPVLMSREAEAKCSSLGSIPIKPIGMGRIIASFVVAVGADGFQWLIPPAFWLADGFALIALFLLWGFRLEIILFLIPEVIPGLDLFPTWIVAVLVLATRNKPVAT